MSEAFFFRQGKCNWFVRSLLWPSSTVSVPPPSPARSTHLWLKVSLRSLEWCIFLLKPLRLRDNKIELRVLPQSC